MSIFRNPTIHRPLFSCRFKASPAYSSFRSLTMPAYTHLIRFQSKDGSIYYGDAILPRGVSDLSHVRSARVITGDIFGQHVVTDQVASVSRLLTPLSPSDVRTVRCLGLNYAKHAAEAQMPKPTYPVLFYKPVTCLAGPTDPIPIPRMAQEGGELGSTGVPNSSTSPSSLDYECELVIIIGKAARDVPESQALDAVLGYCVGNDVSQRDWQIKKGGGQWGLGKGFDGWAPLGPGIVTRDQLPDGARGLRISTRVNGVARQDESTADLIFGVAETVAFLSQGTTLLPGDVIFTGTPAGVALGMREPAWLQDGDVVEVALEGVGTITNKVRFETDRPKL